MEIRIETFGRGESVVEVDAEAATTFQYFPSYSRAAKSMDAERRLCFAEAIEVYGCYGLEPDFIFCGDGWLESAFEAVRVSLDRSRKGCINGRKGGRPRKTEPKEDAGAVENSVDGDGKGVLTLSENGLKPKEKKRKEKNEERKELAEGFKGFWNSSDRTGDGPGSSNGPATPSPEEVRAEAAMCGYMWADLDAFAESLPSMPPGTDWKLELGKADMAAWGEANGMEVVDVGEAV